MQEILEQYTPFSLEDISKSALMKRLDLKFTFNENKLESILEKLKNDFGVLKINNKRQGNYRSFYFDTPDHYFYMQHHNSQRSRYKVRFREYSDSEKCFLEVKIKNNKDRTEKHRIEVPKYEQSLSKNSMEFLSQFPFLDNLNLVLAFNNQFQRITLIGKSSVERITIDTNVVFSLKDVSKPLERIVIAELKQEKTGQKSMFYNLMKEMKIVPNSMSKYCIGSSLLFEDLKKNNFKPKLRHLKKISESSN